VNDPVSSPDGAWMWDGEEWAAVPPHQGGRVARAFALQSGSRITTPARLAVIIVLVIAAVIAVSFIVHAHVQKQQDERYQHAYCQSFGENDPDCP
jgi:hypothetical protein